MIRKVLHLDYPNRSRCRLARSSRIHPTHRKILAQSGSLVSSIERKDEIFAEIMKISQARPSGLYGISYTWILLTKV